MNPDTNKFEKLIKTEEQVTEIYESNTEMFSQLLRPDGSPVPKTWSIFTEGENVAVKDYTFKVAHVGESYLVLEPVGPIEIGKAKLR